MRAALLVAALLLLVARPARAEVDFLDQSIVVDLASDPAKLDITCTVKLSVTSETTQLTLLNTLLPVVSLAWNGTPLQVKTYPKQGIMTAALPVAAQPGAKATLTAQLSGTPSCSYGAGYIFCARGPQLTWLTSFVTSWYLYNVDGTATDPHTGSIQVIMPAGHRAATMGMTPKVEQGNGTTTWTFAWSRPASELQMVAGALQELVSPAGGFRARALCADDAAVKTAMQTTVDQASKLMDFFGGLWGAAPIDEIGYGVVSGATPWAGESMEGLILLNDMLFYPELAYILPEINHELGHLWWGTMAAAAPGALESGYFNESFAEYSLWRGRGHLEGEAVRDSGTRMNSVWYMYRRPAGGVGDVPVLSQLGSELAVFAIYHKGSTAVRTLEEMVGVDAVDAGLRSLVAAGQGHGTLTGFLDAVQTAAGGVDLAAYVEKWLKGKGYPTLRVTSALTAQTGTYRLVLTAAGEDFPMSLPVKISYADGAVDRNKLAYTGGGELQVELKARPAVVELDPGWTAVREVQPALDGDVSLDGRVDGADLIEVALRVGGFLPEERRKDGKYDPLYDLDGDRLIGDGDLDAVVKEAAK
jgi:hypothetical protein